MLQTVPKRGKMNLRRKSILLYRAQSGGIFTIGKNARSALAFTLCSVKDLRRSNRSCAFFVRSFGCALFLSEGFPWWTTKSSII